MKFYRFKITINGIQYGYTMRAKSFLKAMKDLLTRYEYKNIHFVMN